MKLEEAGEPSIAERVGAVFVVVVLLVVAACLVAEFTQLSERFVSGAAAYSGFGLCVLAWRWPGIFTGPIKKLAGRGQDGR